MRSRHLNECYSNRPSVTDWCVVPIVNQGRGGSWLISRNALASGFCEVGQCTAANPNAELEQSVRPSYVGQLACAACGREVLAPKTRLRATQQLNLCNTVGPVSLVGHVTKDANDE
jgi:hypothetical protein